MGHVASAERAPPITARVRRPTGGWSDVARALRVLVPVGGSACNRARGAVLGDFVRADRVGRLCARGGGIVVRGRAGAEACPVAGPQVVARAARLVRSRRLLDAAPDRES